MIDFAPTDKQKFEWRAWAAIGKGMYGKHWKPPVGPVGLKNYVREFVRTYSESRIYFNRSEYDDYRYELLK